MARHIAHRLVISLPVFLGALLIRFLLLQVVPTDPATVSAGPAASKADIDRQEMGLDKPCTCSF
jgi:ABC-type dipeptide/oligopeptide/nickel transport system permease component